VSNLNHADYVKIICGSLEQLPDVFAKLDREECTEESVLQRNNKDAVLKKRICALIIAEKRQKEEKVVVNFLN
jgi:hypothetical protein